jgi:prevent-host-death family protein
MAFEVDVHEAETRLPGLLERAVAGDEVIIMQAGRRMVRLTPVEGESPGPTPRFERRLGTAKGMFVVPDDFNDPLPDDILDEFEK